MAENERKMVLQSFEKWTLLPYKCFYFLHSLSTGCLFPFLMMFYKQLRFSSQQASVLLLLGPLTTLVGIAIWGIIADYYNKSKLIFLVSLLGGLLSNFVLFHHDRATYICHNNETLVILEETLKNFSSGKSLSLFPSTAAKTWHGKSNRSYNTGQRQLEDIFNEKRDKILNELDVLGHSLWSLTNLNIENHHETADNELFYKILLLTIVANFISSPTIPFADTATLYNLGDATDDYGKQRSWSALGYGLSSFVVTSVAATIQEKNKCNGPITISFRENFYAFTFLMITAFIPALLLHFEDRQTGSITISKALTSLLNSECLILFSITLLLQSGSGVTEIFLFLHLHNLGGTQFMFSLVHILRCFSECAMFFLAGNLIALFGHYKLLYISLLFSVLRFITYGLINDPWHALPIEMLHGVSTSLVRCIAVSFITVKGGILATLQGLLHGFFIGVGYIGGATLAGFLVRVIGLRRTFFLFGTAFSLTILLILFARNVETFYYHCKTKLNPPEKD